MSLRSRSSLRMAGWISFLWLVVAGASAAEACKCADSAVGFHLAEGTRLPANAAGIPWVGHVRDSARAGGKPIASDFRIEVRDGSFWRALVTEVVEPPDLAQARKGPDDEQIVLVRPRGGFQPGSLYRMSSSLSAERSNIEFPVADRSFWPERTRASVTVSPAVRGPVVAATRSGSCATTFQGVATTVRLVLPEFLEPFRGALLFALVDEQGRLWRPDANLCERTPTGGNSLGPGEERIYAYCGPLSASPAESTDTRGQPTDLRPDEEFAQGKDLKFEFVAWLPGTKERISAKGKVTLECADRGR